MASTYIRKNSPYHWIRYKKPCGGWGSKSSGVKVGSRGEKGKLKSILDELKEDEHLSRENTGAAFHLWVEEWLTDHYDYNHGTRDSYITQWRSVEEYLNHRGTHYPVEVSYQLCHEYYKWRTSPTLCEAEGRRVMKSNRAKSNLSILAIIIEEARRRSYISHNPCRRLGLRNAAVKSKQEISVEDQDKIERLLLTSPQWMRDCWLVLMTMGCRISEVGMEMSNIDVQSMKVSFKIKGGHMHTAPLHKKLLPLYERRKKEGEALLVDHHPEAGSYWWRWFRSNGFTHYSIHCTRVTVITRLARSKVAESHVMRYIGHCSKEVHAIYRKLEADDVGWLGDMLD